VRVKPSALPPPLVSVSPISVATPVVMSTTNRPMGLTGLLAIRNSTSSAFLKETS
jgi:hypothetical protein